MNSTKVNLSRLHELYTEREQLHAYNHTHQEVAIVPALDPAEQEIKGLEAVAVASITEMVKEGYRNEQIGDFLVYGGLEQHEADALITRVKQQFEKLFA